MRTKNSLKNVVIALICNTITLLIGFFSQSLFVQKLGIEYSGLNNVFSNVISMLSISELGIGSAIIYNLYKPIFNNDISSIKSLMSFYKKAYRVIALVVLVIGICILPFIKYFVNAININENIYVVYLFFLIDSVVSYLATYKRSLIYANQKNWIIDIIHLGYTLSMNLLQIFILLQYRSYILYLIIKIVCRIIENFILSCVADRLYPYLKQKDIKSLSADTKTDIKMRVKAQLLHSIGGYIVLGTDNIIISKFLGLAVSGIYGNYILITNAANTILSQVFTGITASIGNLLTEENKDKNYQVYTRIHFANFLIYGVIAIVFVFAINDFIVIWLKSSQYIFTNLVVLILAVNFYMQGMRRTMQVFATAAGICYENRFVPLIESIINIFTSLILLKFFGVLGVIMGTIISTFILFFYSFPKYIYVPLFDKKGNNYIKEFINYTFIEIIIFIINYFIINFISINNLYINFFIHTLISFFITISLFMVIFRKKEEFLYFKKIIISKFRR